MTDARTQAIIDALASPKPHEGQRKLAEALGVSPRQATQLMIEQQQRDNANNPARSVVGKALLDAALGATSFINRNVFLPAESLGDLFKASGEVEARNARFANSRAAPEATPNIDLAALFGGGEGPSLAPPVVGFNPLEQRSLQLALAGAGGRQSQQSFQGLPLPTNVPQQQIPENTDFSQINDIIEAFRPDEFDETAYRKDQRWPTFFESLAQGGMNALGLDGASQLFALGMGALASRGVLEQKVAAKRAEYEDRTRDYLRLALEGKYKEAAVRRQEAEHASNVAFSNEAEIFKNNMMRSNAAIPQISAQPDGSFVAQQFDPNTGQVFVKMVKTADLLAQADILASMGGRLADRQSRREAIMASAQQSGLSGNTGYILAMASDIVEGRLGESGYFGSPEMWEEVIKAPARQSILAGDAALLGTKGKEQAYKADQINRVAQFLLSKPEQNISAYARALQETGRPAGFSVLSNRSKTRDE